MERFLMDCIRIKCRQRVNDRIPLLKYTGGEFSFYGAFPMDCRKSGMDEFRNWQQISNEIQALPID